jgi:RNA polymerase sigma-70 factor (ECF subfamily)
MPEPTLHTRPKFHAEDSRDAQLMFEAAKGSDEAFEELIKHHQNGLLNFFARMGAYSQCEDLAQETFIRLYRYRTRYLHTARFRTFLYTIARNVWNDSNRKIVRIERLGDELENQAAVENQARNAPPKLADALEGALGKLSPKLREVLVLNFYQGLRYQEVAEVLGIPLGTVKSRINLAVNALRELLKHVEE